MDVFSELKQAQLEVNSSGLTPNANKVGQIAYKDSSTPMEINDGSEIHKVLTDKMYEEIKDAVIAPVNYSLSGSSGSFSTTSTTPVDVTNLSVTLTTTGRPIEVYLSGGSIGTSSGAAAYSTSYFSLLMDDAVIPLDMSISIEATDGSALVNFVPSSSFKRFLESVPAGSHTFKIQAYSGSAFTTTSVSNCTLIVKEL